MNDYITMHYSSEPSVIHMGGSEPSNWTNKKLDEKADAWEMRCKMYEEKIRSQLAGIPLTSEPKSVKELLGAPNRKVSYVLARASELGFCKKAGNKYYL